MTSYLVAAPAEEPDPNKSNTPQPFTFPRGKIFWNSYPSLEITKSGLDDLLDAISPENIHQEVY